MDADGPGTASNTTITGAQRRRAGASTSAPRSAAGVSPLPAPVAAAPATVDGPGFVMTMSPHKVDIDALIDNALNGSTQSSVPPGAVSFRNSVTSATATTHAARSAEPVIAAARAPARPAGEVIFEVKRNQILEQAHTAPVQAAVKPAPVPPPPPPRRSAAGVDDDIVMTVDEAWLSKNNAVPSALPTSPVLDDRIPLPPEIEPVPAMQAASRSVSGSSAKQSAAVNLGAIPAAEFSSGLQGEANTTPYPKGWTTPEDASVHNADTREIKLADYLKMVPGLQSQEPRKPGPPPIPPEALAQARDPLVNRKQADRWIQTANMLEAMRVNGELDFAPRAARPPALPQNDPGVLAHEILNGGPRAGKWSQTAEVLREIQEGRELYFLPTAAERANFPGIPVTWNKDVDDGMSSLQALAKQTLSAPEYSLETLVRDTRAQVETLEKTQETERKRSLKSFFDLTPEQRSRTVFEAAKPADLGKSRKNGAELRLQTPNIDLHINGDKWSNTVAILRAVEKEQRQEAQAKKAAATSPDVRAPLEGKPNRYAGKPAKSKILRAATAVATTAVAALAAFFGRTVGHEGAPPRAHAAKAPAPVPPPAEIRYDTGNGKTASAFARAGSRTQQQREDEWRRENMADLRRKLAELQASRNEAKAAVSPGAKKAAAHGAPAPR
jgi:hypothetical protein